MTSTHQDESSNRPKLAAPLIAGLFGALVLACVAFLLLGGVPHEIEHELVIQPLQPGRLVIEVQYDAPPTSFVKRHGDVEAALNRGALKAFGSSEASKDSTLGETQDIDITGNEASSYKKAFLLRADAKADELLDALSSQLESLPPEYRIQLFSEYRTLDSARQLIRKRRAF